jgi:hypothetical protein
MLLKPKRDVVWRKVEPEKFVSAFYLLNKEGDVEVYVEIEQQEDYEEQQAVEDGLESYSDC